MKFWIACLMTLLFAGSATAMSPAEEIAAKQAALNNPSTGPSQPMANPAGFSGTLEAADPDWHRPFADGTCCSGLGPVDYKAQIFHVTSTGTCNLASIQSGWDGYIFLYRAPFSSGAQTVNFVAGDDDGSGGIGTSNIDGVNLTAYTDYVFVTTGFENGERGAFTNAIDCASGDVILGSVSSNVSNVPTLQTWALLLLAAVLMGMFAMQRRSAGHR